MTMGELFPVGLSFSFELCQLDQDPVSWSYLPELSILPGYAEPKGAAVVNDAAGEAKIQVPQMCGNSPNPYNQVPFPPSQKPAAIPISPLEFRVISGYEHDGF